MLQNRMEGSRRISIGALTLVLALAMLMVPMAGNAAATTVSVGQNPADVYATAAAGSPIIGQLPAGSRVQVNSFDDNWAEVIIGGGAIGYVITSYLNFGAPVPTLPPYNPTTPPVQTTVSVGNGPLNVHSAPTLRAPVISQLATGARVQLSSFDSNWAEVILGEGRVGYVVTSYLNFGAPVPNPTAHPTATHHVKAETEGANATVSTSNNGPLHLRMHADIKSDIIYTYANGSRLQVLSQKGEWYYVKAGTNYGYMESQYIRLDSGVTLEPNDYYDGFVNNATDGEILHLRQRPTTESESLGEYHNGTYVEVLVVGTEWHQVIVDDIKGYMKAEFVHITSPEATAEMKLVGGTNGNVELYDRPSAIANKVGELANDTVVTVVIPDDEWTEIQYQDGGSTSTVYVMNENLQRIEMPEEVG